MGGVPSSTQQLAGVSATSTATAMLQGRPINVGKPAGSSQAATSTAVAALQQQQHLPGEGEGEDTAGQAPDQAFNFEAEESGVLTWRFELEASRVEFVKERCLPGGLNYPLMEEYDFRNDPAADLGIELKPKAELRRVGPVAVAASPPESPDIPWPPLPTGPTRTRPSARCLGMAGPARGSSSSRAALASR